MKWHHSHEILKDSSLENKSKKRKFIEKMKIHYHNERKKTSMRESCDWRVKSQRNREDKIMHEFSAMK